MARVSANRDLLEYNSRFVISASLLVEHEDTAGAEAVSHDREVPHVDAEFRRALTRTVESVAEASGKTYPRRVLLISIVGVDFVGRDSCVRG